MAQYARDHGFDAQEGYRWKRILKRTGQWVATDVGATVSKCRKLFDEAIAATDYRATLRLYNCKGVISFVAKSLGINKDVYCRIVLELIKSERSGVVANAMRQVIN